MPPSVEASGELAAGTLIDGRYRVVERIGGGGMGSVFRAVQIGAVGRDIAIKVLNESSLKNQIAVRRFENEARIIAQLRHPHTLKLVDSGHLQDGRLYLVTEFLIGQPLDKRLMQGRLSPQRTLQVMDEVAESLAEAHALGIIHRDLKPGNIFLEQVGAQEIVRVLDFGIAKLVNHPGLTTPMQVFGTPGYMSPEQARGEEVDARSDLFSLGVVAYECLAGRLPFQGTTPVAMIVNQARGTPTPLDQVVAPELIGPEVVALVMSLLAPRPQDRPSSISELRGRIETIARGRSVSNLIPPAATPPPGSGARWTETSTDREVGFDDTALREPTEPTVPETTEPTLGEQRVESGRPVPPPTQIVRERKPAREGSRAGSELASPSPARAWRIVIPLVLVAGAALLVFRVVTSGPVAPPSAPAPVPVSARSRITPVAHVDAPPAETATTAVPSAAVPPPPPRRAPSAPSSAGPAPSKKPPPTARPRPAAPPGETAPAKEPAVQAPAGFVVPDLGH